MSKTITVGEFQIEVTKKKMKNMRLRVLPPDGKICISAPKNVSDKKIYDFVLSHTEWIKETSEKVRQKSAFADNSLKDSFYLFGKKYTLKKQEGKKKSLVLKDGCAILTLPNKTKPEEDEKYITEWYRKKLKETIPSLLSKWEKITGLSCSSWQIRDMTSRWGSCSVNTKSIRLNLQLAKRPEICLEYVILHELAHTKVAGHGPDFKAILDKHMPDWRNVKKLLNSFPFDTVKN